MPVNRSLVRRLDAWLAGRPRPVIVLAGLAAVAGLGYLDFVTGPELTPLIFYLLPVVGAAWYGGRAPGAVVAVAGGLSWMLADAVSHGGYAHAAVPYWNAGLRLAALIGVAEAVARLHAAVAQARALARTDDLTGVPNRRSFYEAAEREIARARRYPHPFSVVYLDLDEFKMVNDRLGHVAGDAVLRSVARVLRGVLRASDTIARLGGDEFLILLPEAGPAPARLTVDKLREALAGIVPAHGWRLTASVGVVTFLVPPDSPDVLLAAADRLMYAAKRAGKNRIAQETQNEALAAP